MTARGAAVDPSQRAVKNLTRAAVGTNYSPATGGFGTANFTATIVAAGGDGYLGRAYRRVTLNGPFTPTPGQDLILLNDGMYGLSTLGMTIPTDLGRPYSLAIPVRCSVAQRVHAQAQMISPTSGGAGSKVGPDVTLAPNTWINLIVENAIPITTSVGLRVDVDLASTAAIPWLAADTFDVARPFICEGATLPPGVI